MAQLPPDMQQEVQDFAKFLVGKWERRRCKKLRLDWAGELREFCDHYRSLDLQKKSQDFGAIDVADRPYGPRR